MPRFLVHFAQFHLQFRLPELESLAKLENVAMSFDAATYSDDCAFLVVELPSVEDAQRLISRAILVKDIIELWATGDSLQDMFDNIRSDGQYLRTLSFKFHVEAVGRSLTLPEQIERIETMEWLGFDGPFDLKAPTFIFSYFEDYGFNGTKGLPIPEQPLQRFFGRWIAKGNRGIVTQYDLKKRGYLGTTSMDAELSLVMANQALVGPGSLVLDPFVGTGSFLVSCAHFGAYTMGSDIDGRQIRGTGQKSIESNVAQYKLENLVLGTLVCDIAHHPFRKVGWWDAIVCDPPYGVRAGAKKISRNPKIKPMDPLKPNGEMRFPQTVVYEMEDVIADLINFSADYLNPGGRLVFWLPTLNEQYEPQDIPTHPKLRLISNSEQSFGKWSRRLITMEKLSAAELAGLRVDDEPIGTPSSSRTKELGHAGFRAKYFEAKPSTPSSSSSSPTPPS
ncbi:S-adenosyl-L-methionine-dependent methyltransferase [Entophlyctis helioformis]|nr:S-adenosyl-L-methionine-dependent methyltransferase [Entophlyctis helioformis]